MFDKSDSPHSIPKLKSQSKTVARATGNGVTPIPMPRARTTNPIDGFCQHRRIEKSHNSPLDSVALRGQVTRRDRYAIDFVIRPRAR